jgi:large subunit ribosomal protein L25
MAGADTTSLTIQPRSVEGSRATRRLRRSGLVPGVVYGGGDAPPVPFAVDARILRNTLAHAHAVLELSLDGGATQPVIVKDLQRHPVRGEILHVDFLRVRMDRPIQSTVSLELVGAETAPGVVAGGILSQETRELAIEALPGDIPDTITHDVSDLELNATLTVSAITAPPGVTLLDDPEETVVATITPPSAEPSDDEIETETEVIGDAAVDSVEAQAAAGGSTASEADQQARAAEQS